MHVLFAFYRYFYELQAPRNQLDFDFEQMLAHTARAHYTSSSAGFSFVFSSVKSRGESYRFFIYFVIVFSTL